jgi:PIN domain nuclease of toxin-antitoxin system
MIAGVADTHTAPWYLYGDSRLSKPAKTFIDDAAAAVKKIAVSAISLAEIVYLVERKRVPASAYHDLRSALSDPDHVFVEEPLSADVVEAMHMIPATTCPICPIASSPPRLFISKWPLSAVMGKFALPVWKRSGDRSKDLGQGCGSLPSPNLWKSSPASLDKFVRVQMLVK